jgi:hypothetical protein
MNQDISLALKSTIDKRLLALATEKGYGFFDLDGIYQDTGSINTVSPAIAWAFQVWAESPKDPMWEMSFEAGARTSEDLSQYDSMRIAGQVVSLFPSGEDFEIFDYSSSIAGTTALGRVFITHSMVVPVVFSDSSTLRMGNIQAKVLRYRT